MVDFYPEMQETKVMTMATRHRSGKALALLLAVLLTHAALAAPVTQTKGEASQRRGGAYLRLAQVPPEIHEIKRYTGLHAAAANGETTSISRLASAGENINARDSHGRTPLMVAAYAGHRATAKALIAAGANINALDYQRYDLLTIVSVLNDLDMVKLAFASGADAKLITSPYDGTALIAAAHLGHVEVVRALIKGNSPLDHVNNLGWTALIEAIVLRDGGPRHTAIVGDLIKAGANLDLADGQGNTPLALAHQHGYQAIIDILRQAGARP